MLTPFNQGESTVSDIASSGSSLPIGGRYLMVLFNGGPTTCREINKLSALSLVWLEHPANKITPSIVKTIINLLLSIGYSLYFGLCISGTIIYRYQPLNSRKLTVEFQASPGHNLVTAFENVGK